MKTKERFFKALKIAIGAFVAISIASVLGLRNSVSAGIITLLSIQNTKKETILLAVKRLVAFILSIIITYICFSFIDFTTFSFAIYLFVFSLLCIYLNIPDSISVCAVLSSQILVAGEIPFSLILNQFLVLLIGASIGVFLNLYMGDKLKVIQQKKTSIDEKTRRLLSMLAELLTHKISTEEVLQHTRELEDYVSQAVLDAEELESNVLLTDYSYYTRYLQLRKSQISILSGFASYDYKPEEVSVEEEIIANCLRRLAKSFGECNNAMPLLKDLKDAFQKLQNLDLPESKDKFESRATLYFQISALEDLILIKNSFIESLTKEQFAVFQQQCSASAESFSTDK